MKILIILDLYGSDFLILLNNYFFHYMIYVEEFLNCFSWECICPSVVVVLILVLSSSFFKETLSLPVSVKSFCRFENFSSILRFMLCTDFRYSPKIHVAGEELSAWLTLSIFPY